MVDIKDGGSAFPTQLQSDRSQVLCDAGPGMSLRDWFAGQALTGNLARDVSVRGETWQWNKLNPEELAVWSYAVADAMIEAREAPTGGSL